MQKPNWKNLIDWCRKYLVNKYLITVSVFAVVLTFCGSQSLVNRIRMAREISAKESELREYKRKISNAEADLRALDNPDSLERFAREHYYMRVPGEDVFLIEE